MRIHALNSFHSSPHEHTQPPRPVQCVLPSPPSPGLWPPPTPTRPQLAVSPRLCHFAVSILACVPVQCLVSYRTVVLFVSSRVVSSRVASCVVLVVPCRVRRALCRSRHLRCFGAQVLQGVGRDDSGCACRVL